MVVDEEDGRSLQTEDQMMARLAINHLRQRQQAVTRLGAGALTNALSCPSNVLDEIFDFSDHNRSSYPGMLSLLEATVSINPHVFPDSHSLGSSHILSVLPSQPKKPSLAIGSTTKLPPTPNSFTENPSFLSLLHQVLSQHAHQDPAVISQASVMASSAGAGLGSGGVFFPHQQNRRRKTYGGGGGAGGDGAGPASAQGGVGGAGRGGYIHVSDIRHPPDFGRIAEPEDIFGSLEVDGDGHFVGANGNYQPSGTYRIITRDGILGLSPFLREKLVQRLQQENV